MGFDIGQLFGNAAADAAKGAQDLLKQGATAGLGYLEGQAVAVISDDQKKNQAAFQTSVASALKKPGDPNGFGAYLSGLLEGPALKQYSPYILVAVAVIAVGTLAVAKRLIFVAGIIIIGAMVVTKGGI